MSKLIQSLPKHVPTMDRNQIFSQFPNILNRPAQPKEHQAVSLFLLDNFSNKQSLSSFKILHYLFCDGIFLIYRLHSALYHQLMMDFEYFVIRKKL